MFKVFYSWQSDLPGQTNRRLIQSALEAACAELKTEGGIIVEPVVDRDTLGVSGAPDIRSTILEKIEDADAFVADVSLLNIAPAASSADPDPLDNGTPTKLTPNPNVLTELGYAMAHMGNEAMVLVVNTHFGSLDNLPFDLRPLRKLSYEADPAMDLESIKSIKKELIGDFKKAIRTIGQTVRSDPVHAIILPKTRSVVGQAEEVIRSLVKAASKQYDEKQITKDELLDVCKYVNPYGQAPLIIGRDAVGNLTHGTWMDYLRHYRQRSGKFTTDILVLSPFLKEEHVALLATIEQCSYFWQVETLPSVQFKNTSFEWLAGSIWEYLVAARRLSVYAEKILARRAAPF